MELKNCELWIKANNGKELDSIVKGMIERYGGEKTIEDISELFGEKVLKFG